MNLTTLIVRHLPWKLQRLVYRAQERQADKTRAAQSPQEVFSQVYADGRWGAGGESRFFSGWGSHDQGVVGPYIDAVRAFVQSLPAKPAVVDLGCGDFNIGRRIRPFCGRYVACDVVPSLVDHNRSAFKDLDVDFRCLDITSEALPDGNVVFIRQMLQHLSNGHIAKVVGKLQAFQFVIVTEHLPGTPDFVPNLEKGAGDDVRASRVTPSAVVLTEAPFRLAPKRSQVLCAIPAHGGIIQTTLYEM